MKKINKTIIITIALSLGVLTLFFVITIPLKTKLITLYAGRQSVELRDKNNQTIKIYQNSFGNYAIRKSSFPEEIKQLIIQKEDRFFYYHLGVNPVSTARAIKNYITKTNKPTASTMTQQLAKILLGQVGERSFYNKLKEAVYTIALELHTNKEEIFNMYLNTVFLGNKAEGFNTASLVYFNKKIEILNLEEQLQLLATLSNPSNANPFTRVNIAKANWLANNLSLETNEAFLKNPSKEKSLEQFNGRVQKTAAFELGSLDIDINTSATLTIDNEINKKIRKIINVNIENLYKSGALNAAAVIIAINKKKTDNKIISIIGSPDPSVDAYGYKINMAVRPRAIGSTIKPFIYAKGFSAGLRPYTLVEDREYKYMIGTGYAFYPKNYDYEYRGTVNLHYALANSLNVPTVKVLEYVGLENFYSFLTDELKFVPIQDLNNYQLGIALGELEMDLLSLTNYFTIFPNEGVLKPLKISSEHCFIDGTKTCPDPKEIFSPQYVALINKILSDRRTGIEEFGIKSNLNLPFDNYAVKTGTSREFHDSWTIGYTPNFVVGVWVGNAQDQPMDKISGQSGAGKIWQDIMNLLLNSSYNKNNSFDFSYLEEFTNENNINIGLRDDNYETQKNLLEDKQLIRSPHDLDEFLFEKGMSIPLKSGTVVDWTINNKLLGQSQEHALEIAAPGVYEIKATNHDQSEIITVYVNSN